MGARSLFDIIYASVGCPFISDLRVDKWRPDVLVAIRSISPDAYSEDEWRELAGYLTRRDPPEMDAGSCREYLMEFLDI